MTIFLEEPAQSSVSGNGVHRFRMFQSMARSHQTAAEPIPSVTVAAPAPTPIAFDTQDINTDGMWSGGSQFKAPIAGMYLCVGGVAFGPSSAGTFRALAIRKTDKNGITAIYGAMQVPPIGGVTNYLNVSDSVQFSRRRIH